MSARYNIARSVLDTAVRYYMPPSDVAKLINNIFNDLDWDNCYPNPYSYTIEDLNYFINHLDNLFSGNELGTSTNPSQFN